MMDCHRNDKYIARQESDRSLLSMLCDVRTKHFSLSQIAHTCLKNLPSIPNIQNFYQPSAKISEYQKPLAMGLDCAS